MTSIDIVKSQIQELYRTHPNIHINVSMTRPKVSLKNEPVTIKGVYPHIFQIEDQSSGTPKCYTIQYADILTKSIKIAELAEV